MECGMAFENLNEDIAKGDQIEWFHRRNDRPLAEMVALTRYGSRR